MIILRNNRWQKNDKKLRENFFNNEVLNKVLKSLIYNSNYSRYFHLYFYKLFQKLSRNTSIARPKRGCLWSGDSRVIFQRFKLSRHMCKKWAAKGYIPGLRKSSF